MSRPLTRLTRLTRLVRLAYFAHLARLAALVALAAALAACRVDTSTARVSAPGAPWGDGLVAGVARRDITPPPGLSLLGHGPEGRVAAGTRIRLYCTAFVIARGDEAIALLPCDLQAPSLELQRAIADRVAAQEPRLGADRILLMASHTHAAPGHYFGARQYGGTFSSRAPGFDPAVLDHLAERAAAAVLEAARSVHPAEVGWRVLHCAGGGLVKNRSLPALTHNRALPAALRAQILDGCAGFLPGQGDALAGQDRLAPAELAADLRLAVLRIDRLVEAGERRPLGAFAVFGIHNTAIPNDNDLYHADVFGFALREAEAEIRRSLPPAAAGDPPVLVGLANGIQGDISPATTSPSVAEARRIGQELGRRVAHAFLLPGPTLPDDGVLARAYRELRLPGAVAAPAGKGPPPRLCDAPEIGAAAAGGAEDGPTWLRIFPQMKEGALAATPHPCHGRKLALRGPEGRFTDDGLDFPNVAPISLVRLGGALLAATPFEMTTVVGYRLRAALAAIAHPARPGDDDVILVGLTNSYLQYVSTADEYAIQHYEGASTLYGPHTAAFLGHHLACLARALHGGGSTAACDLDQRSALNQTYPVAYAPDRVARMPRATASSKLPPADDLPVASTLTDPWRSYVVRWDGASHGAAPGPAPLSVRVIDAAGALLDDDHGTSMEVRHDAARHGGRGWLVRWTPRWDPPGGACGREVRFEIEHGRTLRSRPFLVDCEPALTERPEAPRLLPLRLPPSASPAP